MSQPWSLLSFPATATAPSASQSAAGSTLVNRLRALQVGVATNGTAQPPVNVVVRDGSAGAGTIIWEASLSAVIDGGDTINLSQLDLRSSPGNALTVEFTAAPANAVQGYVNAQGDLCAVGKAYGQD